MIDLADLCSHLAQPVMSGLDTVFCLRHLRRKDLVVGVTGEVP